jgi:hypothetical protein
MICQWIEIIEEPNWIEMHFRFIKPDGQILLQTLTLSHFIGGDPDGLADALQVWVNKLRNIPS